MIFEEIVTKSQLVQIFGELGLGSESTVNKLASGNCSSPGFDGFPPSRQVGATRAWLRAQLEKWLETRFSAGALDAAKTKEPVHTGSGRGRPPRRERMAAAQAGLSVPEWRRQQAGES